MTGMIWDKSKYLVRLEKYFPRQRIESLMEWTLVRRILQRYAVNLVLDVGASRGQYAHNLRQIGYMGFICSFEPIPEEFANLEETMSGDTKWKGYQFALGNADKSKVPHIPEASSVMSSFLRHKDHAAKMRHIEVSMKRLDSMCEELTTLVAEPRIFLKIDTQGFDLQVIEGGLRFLEQVICLQSEISVDPIYEEMPHYLSALERYEELGFRLSGLYEVARHRLQETVVEMNCIMVRPEASRIDS